MYVQLSSLTPATSTWQLKLCIFDLQGVQDRRAEVSKYSTDKEYKRKVDEQRRAAKPKKEDPGLSGIIIPLPPFGNSEMDNGEPSQASFIVPREVHMQHAQAKGFCGGPKIQTTCCTMQGSDLTCAHPGSMRAGVIQQIHHSSQFSDFLALARRRRERKRRRRIGRGLSLHGELCRAKARSEEDGRCSVMSRLLSGSVMIAVQASFLE